MERLPRRLAAALFCLAILGTPAQGQERAWQGYMIAGESAHRTGNLAAARAGYEAALEAAADFEGQDPRLGLTLSSLAKVYGESGETALAELLGQRAIGIWEAAPRLGALPLAAALEELGGLYLDQDRTGEAAVALGRALALRQANLPAGHPSLARSRKALAALPPEPQGAARNEGATLPPTPETEAPNQSGAALPAPIAPRGGADAGFALHLASLKSAGGAAREWASLQRNFPGLLGDMSLTLEQVDLGDRGVFQRVLAVPFPNKATALDLCAQILAAQQYCQVVPLK